ncbi:putative RTA1 domain protein [Trematosphaeria pertusa]|uniref:Putative RTA1 domain protein n=1 Tax=Trematosphaeria pertusa TaxID=390896 RepID=A0A6A6J249_9PLEO|nr:putative RTA1 domain protein [Trematosphaeria pertusa]KAF2255990.1 putative RTA1 domain protein [Trematosphaeria pertusa]
MAGDEEYYSYTPSLAGAVIAAIVYFFLTSAHVFRLYKTRTWFCIPFILGGLFEVVGYSARARSNADPDVMAPFLMQAILILLAPILFAASVYMFLGRIILATGCASYSLIRPTWLTRIFVGGDIFCFFVQLIGAAMLSSATTKSKLDLANTIVLVGLSAQIVIFGGFMVVGLVFHLRMRKNDPKAALDWNWERYMMSLYAVSVIITLRNLFRVIEYALGDDGYLLSNEWPVYVFDFIPMSIVMAVCVMWYVGKLDFASNGRGDVEMMIDRTEERTPRAAHRTSRRASRQYST